MTPTRQTRAASGVAASVVAALAVAAGGAAALVAASPAHAAGSGDPGRSALPESRCSAAVAVDGFSDQLDGTSVDGLPVTGLSALAATPDGGLLALSDRSALFTLDAATRAPLGVVPLSDAGGAPLDSEGLAADADGTLWVSSEAGPQVLHLGADGAMLGSLEVPAALRVAPQGSAAENASLEGLTLSTDGLTLLAADEGPLAGDADGVVRLQTWVRPDVASPFALGPQYAYQVDPGLGVPEVLFAPDGRLVVLERGYLPAIGNTVRLYLADPRGASDVSGVVDVDVATAADVVLPSSLLADLVTCPPAGATAEQQQLNPLLDNIEGMALISADEESLHLLLVSDDNQRATQTTRLYDLSVDLPDA